MDFLKVLFGSNALTYEQFVQALDAHNGNEANKDKQIKLGNLGSGEYVGKGKYDSLAETLKGKEKELLEANNLIENLKKNTNGNEELQNKIAEYEAEKTKLQNELAEIKVNSAIKVALLSAKVKDVDYVAYKLNEKLKEKGEKLELDDNDNIKRWDSYITDLKAQLPDQFDTTGGEGKPKPYDPNNLPGGGGGDKNVTKEQFLKMGYAERVALKESNEELFKQLNKQ